MPRLASAQVGYSDAVRAHEAAYATYRRRLAASGYQFIDINATREEYAAWRATWEPIDERIYAECRVTETQRTLRQAETALLAWALRRVQRVRPRGLAAEDIETALASRHLAQRQHMARLALLL